MFNAQHTILNAQVGYRACGWCFLCVEKLSFVDMIDDYKNPWKTLSTKLVYENRWIRLEEHQVLNPSGHPGIYGKVHFQNKGIGIVPVDDQGNTWLVGQWRYALDEWSWEIPEGGCPLETDPEATARRELKEETGLTASKLTMIQRTHLSNSVSDEEGFIYLAEGLDEGERELEETEADLVLKKLPLVDAVNMVLNGQITDSLSVMGLLKVARLKTI
jgi:8-oxo-dGTP pyrophosphatase MutT (NUDIX family)